MHHVLQLLLIMDRCDVYYSQQNIEEVCVHILGGIAYHVTVMTNSIILVLKSYRKATDSWIYMNEWIYNIFFSTFTKQFATSDLGGFL